MESLLLLLADIILFAAAAVLLLPILVFSVECWAARAPKKRCERAAKGPRPSVAILVPAHDEERVIESTIRCLRSELTDQDRLVVVADNCTDRTAEVAREAGVEVIERTDADRLGKGFALAFGIEHLRSQPPDVLVLVDADTPIEAGALDVLAREAQSAERPVQAAYVFEPPSAPSARDRISCFALVVKNLVRPLGLLRLGLPCPLTGSGIAMPWSVGERISFDGGNIVEDMQLSVDVAIAGHPPRFCPSARIRGVLPGKKAAAASQRTRWEHGHLQTLLKQTPRLIAEAVKQRRIDLLAMAMDLAVPPLSLLCLAWATMTGVAALAATLGTSWWPVAILGAGGTALATAVLLAWSRYGRDVMPLRTLLAVPLYVLWKVPVYLAFVFRRQRDWLRTERGEETSSSAGEISRQ